VGAYYFVSPNNPGGIAPYADVGSTNYVTQLGQATSTTVMNLKPSVTGVVHG
jgi:hypothetical protein